MMDLPSLFDSKGVFAALSDDLIGTLDTAHALAYEKIKRCADDLAAADNKAALAVERVKACANAVSDFESYIVATFPKLTFHQLWRQTVKGE